MNAYTDGGRTSSGAPRDVAPPHTLIGHMPPPARTPPVALQTRNGPAAAPADTHRPTLSRTKPAGVLDGGCPTGLTRLLPSERAVLERLVVGGTDAAIATALAAATSEVAWCVRKLLNGLEYPSTRAGLVATVLRHHLADYPEPPHPGRLPDEAMALLWSMAAGQTFKMFVKGAKRRTWEAERIRTTLRSQLQHTLPGEAVWAPLTPGLTVYLAWPALAEEAGWPL